MTRKQRARIIAATVFIGLISHLLTTLFPPRLRFPLDISEDPIIVHGGWLLARDGDNVYYSNVNHNSYLYKMRDTANEQISNRRGAHDIVLVGGTVFYKTQGLHSVDVNGRNSKVIHWREVYGVIAIDEYVFYSAHTRGLPSNKRKIDTFCYNPRTGERYLAIENAAILRITRDGIYFRHIQDYGANERNNITGQLLRLCFIDFLTGEITVISDEEPLGLDVWRPVRQRVTEDYRFYVEQYQLMRTDLDGRNEQQIFAAPHGIEFGIVALTEREIVVLLQTGVVAPYRWYYIMDLDGENIREWPE